MPHDLRELSQGPLHCHPGRIAAASLHDGRDLLVAEIQLDSKVQEPALLLAQLRERPLVTLQDFASDRALEWRGRSVLDALRQLVRARASPSPAHLISNTIEDRLANVCLKYPGLPNLDLVEPFDRAQERLLDEIARIEQRSGVAGKPARSPALETRSIAGHQCGERCLIAILGTL